MSEVAWSLEALKKSLSGNTNDIERDEMSVTAVDPSAHVALGVGFGGSVVFVAAQSGEISEFSSERVSLSGDKVFSTDNLSLERAFRLEFPWSEEIEIDCIYALVAGLRQLAIQNSGYIPIDRLKNYLLGSVSSFDINVELGLFGELSVILAATNTALASSLWHSKAFGTYDFSSSKGHIEVKTTLTARRRHWFSYGQLSKMVNDRLTVVSLSTTLVPDGSTCSDLAEQVMDSLDESHQKAFAEKLSEYPINKMGRTFDLGGARSSLKCFGGKQLSASGVLPPKAVDGKFLLDFDLFQSIPGKKMGELLPFGLHISK